MTSDPISGCMLGGAVGDSLGLPAEGMSRQRIAARWRGEWRHRLIMGRGMLSDDTEGIAGAECGPEQIPANWLSGIRDWPLNIGLIRSAAASAAPGSPLVHAPPFVRMLIRNLFFLIVVLLHGLRRLLPPYGNQSIR